MKLLGLHAIVAAQNYRGITMRKLILSTLSSTLLTLAVTAPNVSVAHHSFAVFDFQTQTPFEGTVSYINFRNPHIEMKLKVKGADGTEQEVHFIEGAPANMLVRNGLKPQDIAVGAHINVLGSPLLADKTKFFLRLIKLDDGREVKN
jgi:Family of unknown function (DUF6152)